MNNFYETNSAKTLFCHLYAFLTQGDLQINFNKLKTVRIRVISMLLFFVLLGFSQQSYGQVTGDYRTHQTGNWNTTSTWERWNGASWVTPAPSAPVSTDGTITILSGHTATVTANATADQIVVNAGGQITVNITIIFTIANGAGTDLTVAGTVQDDGTITGPNDVVISSTGVINVSGTLAVSSGNGNLTVNGSLNTSGTAAVSVSSVATMNVTGNITMSGSSTITVSRGNGGTTLVESSTGIITMSGTSQIIGAGNTTQVLQFDGVLEIGSGAILTNGAGGCAFTLSSGATLKIGSTLGITTSGSTGNIQCNGTRTYNAAANYNYNGTALQATGNGLPTAAITGNVIITNSNGVTPTNNIIINTPGSLTVNGLLTPTSGQVMSGTGTLNGTGSTIVTKTGDATGDFGAQYTLTTKTLTNLTVEFAGAAAQKSGTTPYGGLKINNSNGVTLTAGTTVNNTLTLTSGLLILGTNDLTLGGTAIVSGTPSAANMVVTDGTGQLIKTYTATGSFTFPVGDNTGTIEYSPVTIDFSENSTTRNIGVIVTDGNLANNGAAIDYLSRYWSFTDNAAGTYTYISTYNYLAADINGTETSIVPACLYGGSWTEHPGSAVSDTLTVFSLNESMGIIGGRTFSGRKEPFITIYIGTARATGNWNADATWSLTRTGTITTSTANINLTGVGTEFLSELSIGQVVTKSGDVVIGTIATITSNTVATFAANGVSTNSGISYKARRVPASTDDIKTGGFTVTVNGNYSCNTITTLNLNGGITISGSNSLTVAGLATCGALGSTAQTPTFNVNAGTLTCASLSVEGGGNGADNAFVNVTSGTLNVTGLLTLISASGYPTVDIGTGILNAGSLSINNTPGGNTSEVKASTGTINVTGNLSFSGNPVRAKLTFSNSGTLNIGGDLSTGGTFTKSTSSVNFTGAVTQTNNGGYSFYNLSLNNAGTVVTASAGFNVSNILTANANTTLTPAAAAVINNAGATGTITGSGTVKVTRIAATADYSSQYKFTTNTLTGLTVEYAGSGTAQTLSAITYSNLKINNSAGVSVGAATTVNGVLNLTSGILTTSAINLLTLSSTASVTNVSNLSFVNGPLKKTGNSAFVFPVGKTGTGYQAIGISAPGNATDAFTAEYMRLDAYILGTQLEAGLTKLSSCEYWQLDRTTGTPTVDVTLYGNSNSGCSTATGANYFTGSGSLLATLRVAHYNTSTSTWENLGGSGVGTSPDISVTATAVSSFSPFSFSSTGINPLPVKLISFTAKNEEFNSVLNWSTATEKNNDHFTIERSKDGVNFTKVDEVIGAGNSMNIKNYTYTDYNVSTDGYSLFYYRLKQVDFNGAFEYSNIVIVNFAKANTATILTIQPNPFADQLSVNYDLPANGNVTISIIDALGHTLAKNETSAKKGSNTMQFKTADYAKGLYFINVTFNGTSNIYKMIVKN